MERHVRLLGKLLVVFGVIGAIIALVVLLVAGGISGVLGTSNPAADNSLGAIPLSRLFGAMLCILQLALTLPAIFTGIGLQQFRSWARGLAIVLAALYLLAFPLGTALGLYGLFVLFSPETEPLFLNPPKRLNRAR